MSDEVSWVEKATQVDGTAVSWETHSLPKAVPVRQSHAVCASSGTRRCDFLSEMRSVVFKWLAPYSTF